MESSTDNLPRVITEIVPEDDIIELDNYFYNFFNEIKTNTNQPRMNRILLRYIPKYKKFVIGSLGKYGGFSDCYYSEHNNELSHDSVLTIDRVKSILEYRLASVSGFASPIMRWIFSGGMETKSNKVAFVIP